MRNKIFTLVAAFAVSAGCFTAHAQRIGDAVEVDGKTYRLGENMIANGSFEKGVTGWEAGDGTELSTSNFTVHPNGGVNDGAYLQPIVNNGKAGAGSIATAWSIEADKLYYFAYSVKHMSGGTNAPAYAVVSLDNDLHGSEPYKFWGTSEGNGVTPIYGDVTVNGSEWTKNEITFTNTEGYSYLACQFRWLAGTWGFDHFYLTELIADEDWDEEWALQVALADLEDQRSIVEAYKEGEELAEYPGLYAELSDAYDLTYEADEETMDGINAEITRLKEILATAKAGVVLAQELSALVLEYTTLVDLGYPGQEEFLLALQTANDVAEGEETTYAMYKEQIELLQAARNAYYFSQEASDENPADYTFLIDAPSFYSLKNGLTLEEMTGSNRTTWQDIDSWVSTCDINGDRRTNYLGGKPCWNSWALNFVSMDLHQDLTNVPDGYYSLKCVAMTQVGCINDQHAYLESAGTAVSPIMTVDNGWDTEAGWEALTTEKVAVINGNLRIGFTSTHDASKDVNTDQKDGRNGWFCVTDFQLFYHGPVDETGLKSILDAEVAKAEAMECILNGDKAPLTKAIALAKAATTEEEIVAASDTLTAAVKLVEASNAAYNSFANGTLTPAETAAEELTGDAKEILVHAIEAAKTYCASEEATQSELSTYTTLINNYKTYATALNEDNLQVDIYEADPVYATSLIAAYKEEVATQKAYMLENNATIATINWYIEYLDRHIAAIEASVLVQQAQAAGSNFDMTEMIMNPGAEAETGWVFNKGKGNTNTASGQHYSGDANLRYFDSWNGTTGALNYHAYQVIANLPNGEYKLEFYARNSGTQGVGVYAAVGTEKTDTIWNLQAHTNQSPNPQMDATTGETIVDEEGKPVYDYAGDQWGSVWMNADIDSAEKMANSGNGHGWNEFEITGIQVKDHQMTIGITTDSLLTGVPFDGTWFSVVDFKLTMVSYAADNGNVEDWVSGIEANEVAATAAVVVTVENGVISVVANGQAVKNFEVYTVTGTSVAANARQAAGIYIVKVGNHVQKVVVK